MINRANQNWPSEPKPSHILHRYVAFSGAVVCNPSRAYLEHDAAAYGHVATDCTLKAFGASTAADAAAWTEQARIYAKSAAHSAELAMLSA